MQNKNLMTFAVIAGIVVVGSSLFSASNKNLSQSQNSATVAKSFAGQPLTISTATSGIAGVMKNAQPLPHTTATCGSVAVTQTQVPNIGPLTDNYPSGGQSPGSIVPLRFTVTNPNATCTIQVSHIFLANISRTGGTNFYQGGVFDSINTGTVYGPLYTDQGWGMDNIFATLDINPLILQPGQSADLSVRIDAVHVLGLYHYLPDYFSVGLYRIYAHDINSTVNYATEFNIFSQIIRIE